MNISKAKDKCAKAKDKAKAKVAAKCGGKTKKAVAALAALTLLAIGCQQVPSRSQTLTIRDCTVNVYGGTTTNGTAAVEFGTQAMSIENSGTETQSPTQTTDTKPDVDVSVGAAKGGGILETAAAAATSRLVAPSANAVGSGSSATVNSTGCEGGACEYVPSND